MTITSDLSTGKPVLRHHPGVGVRASGVHVVHPPGRLPVRNANKGASTDDRVEIDAEFDRRVVRTRKKSCAPRPRPGHDVVMRRLFDLWRRAGSVSAAGIPDDELLRRFARDRDPDAFAALLGRHGPLVYGACRRLLPDPLDVEDAFQAAFLVLVRRAASLPGRAVGPWLHRVAVWTARNLRRRNAARIAAAGSLVGAAARPTDLDARLDVDAALSALPRKYREPVILCHLQGWTRRELAAHLGCPESTAASLVGRGVAKLRRRLAARDPTAVLAVAGSAGVPAGLTAATIRGAAVYSTSFSAAAVNPAVASLANGVLRMIRLKKLAAAGAAALAAAVGVGLIGWSGLRVNAQYGQESPAGERARVEQELEAAKRKVDELEARRRTLAEAERDAVPRLLIEVGGGPTPRIVVTEYRTGGKAVGSIETTSVEMMGRFVGRSRKDAAGPKALDIHADRLCPQATIKEVVATVRAAGFEPPPVVVADAVSGPKPAVAGGAGRTPYAIEPPDMLTIEVVERRRDPKGTTAGALPVHPISGQYLVRPDGTVGLGLWGSVSVSGLTLDQAAGAIRSHLAGNEALKDAGIAPASLAVILDVVAYNSKAYYVVLDAGDGTGELVHRFPITGSDTVLDALANLQGAHVPIKPGTNIWISRPAKDGKPLQTLPVDWTGLTQLGNTATNYQLMPGDRVYVKPKK